MTRVLAFVAFVVAVVLVAVAVGLMLHMPWLLALALLLVIQAFVMLVMSRRKRQVGTLRDTPWIRSGPEDVPTRRPTARTSRTS